MKIHMFYDYMKHTFFDERYASCGFFHNLMSSSFIPLYSKPTMPILRG